MIKNKQFQIKFETTDFLIKESIDFLRSNCSGNKNLVCFSGGKDSIVTEHLCKLSGINYELQSTLTGIDPPQVTKFIRANYHSCRFVRPNKSFWHLLTTHNPPGGTGRGIKWCCTKIKEMPSNKNPIRNRILGIRGEESPGRAKYGKINKFNNEIQYYPIFQWSEYHVWDFIERYGLKYPKLYDIGFNRVGCVICPNHQNNHEQYRSLWPNHFKCFEMYVTIWFQKRKLQGKNMWHDSPEDFLKDWYDGKFYYYKPKQGKNQDSDIFE